LNLELKYTSHFGLVIFVHMPYMILDKRGED